MLPTIVRCSRLLFKPTIPPSLHHVSPIAKTVFRTRRYSMATSSLPTITTLPPLPPPNYTPSHHIGNPPTSFRNPWPSSGSFSLLNAFKTRWSSERDFKPVPSTRSELPKVLKPDFTSQPPEGLKATWIGHASWYIETSTPAGKERGTRILFDPVWSDVVGPYGRLGPRRFTEVPCTLDEVPEVDAVVISHNHYDHLDYPTIATLYERNKGRLQIFCPLKLKAWFLSLGIGIKDEEVTELDWWEGVEFEPQHAGRVKLVSTPCQHASGRGVLDHSSTLWCSWILEEIPQEKSVTPRKLFFAGDTAYRTTSSNSPGHFIELPSCPAFSEIGTLYGPFDLALLPIGCYSPRRFMSQVHCSPEDSVCIHKDVRSKKSIGMHFGVFRGNLSAQYEEVTEPARRWREWSEKEGLVWGKDVDVLDVGGRIVV